MSVVADVPRRTSNHHPELDAARKELLPDESSLGPAMKALNERQRLFVIACFTFGAKVQYKRAAKIAGYEGSDGYVRLQAHRLAHNPKVQEALLEESKKRLHASTVAATGLLERAIGDGKVDMQHRLKAAGMVLDRGGLHAMSEQKVSVGYQATREEKLMRLVELARALGQDPRALLGNLADVVEADFKVLEVKELKIAAADAEVTLVDPAPATAALPAALSVDE